MAGDQLTSLRLSVLPWRCVCWRGTHTYRFRQGRVPYCHVQSWLSPGGGRKRGQGAYHTVLVLRGEGSGELLLATCRSAGSSSSYQERDGTSVSRLGWGLPPQPAGEHGPVASGCWGPGLGFLFRGATFIESWPFSALRVEPGCWLPTSSQPISPTSSDQR